MNYPYADYVRPDILSLIPPDGKVIGSIGCGTGAVEAVLVGQGRAVHGVDVSRQAVEIAATRLTTARLIRPDDLRPFEPQSLDGLILADVIEHIPRAWVALAEFSKAVRPGGWIAISVPNMRNVEVAWKFLAGGDWPENATGIYDQTHVQVMTRRRLIRWCGAAGLTIERWQDCYDPNGARRTKFFRTLDALTLELFHSWFMYELQVVCRKPPQEI